MQFIEDRISSALSMSELSLHHAFDLFDVVTLRGCCDALMSGELDLLGHRLVKLSCGNAAL